MSNAYLRPQPLLLTTADPSLNTRTRRVLLLPRASLDQSLANLRSYLNANEPSSGTTLGVRKGCDVPGERSAASPRLLRPKPLTLALLTPFVEQNTRIILAQASKYSALSPGQRGCVSTGSAPIDAKLHPAAPAIAATAANATYTRTRCGGSGVDQAAQTSLQKHSELRECGTSMSTTSSDLDSSSRAALHRRNSETREQQHPWTVRPRAFDCLQSTLAATLKITSSLASSNLPPRDRDHREQPTIPRTCLAQPRPRPAGSHQARCTAMPSPSTSMP